MKASSIKSFVSLVPAILLLACCCIFLTTCKKIELERQVILTTDNVRDMTHTTVTVTGTILDLGEDRIVHHGFHWAVAGQGVLPFDTVSFGGTNRTGAFTETLWNLEPGTRYMVWTYVNDGVREYAAEALEFTTEAMGRPVVETLDTIFVGSREAEIACNVLTDGGSPVTDKGICWSHDPNPILDGPQSSNGPGDGNYRALLPGLQPGQTYFARAYAINELGIAFGDNRKFTTKASELPVVETRLIEVLETVVVSHGFIISNGSSEIIERGMLISMTNPLPNIDDDYYQSAAGTEALYSIDFNELKSYSEHFIRAFAINDAGVGYGEPIRLRTLCECNTDLVDPRDQQAYPTVEIGDQCWMAKNLGFGSAVTLVEGQHENGEPEKFYYDNKAENIETYGGLYQWEEMMQYNMESAQGVCPEGWHIPSDEEWKRMERSLGVPQEDLDLFENRGRDEANMLKTDYRWQDSTEPGNNSSGFSALPAGLALAKDNNFLGLTEYTLFWTSTSSDDNHSISRVLTYDSGQIGRSETGKHVAVSVRCIRD